MWALYAHQYENNTNSSPTECDAVHILHTLCIRFILISAKQQLAKHFNQLARYYARKPIRNRLNFYFKWFVAFVWRRLIFQVLFQWFYLSISFRLSESDRHSVLCYHIESWRTSLNIYLIHSTTHSCSACAMNLCLRLQIDSHQFFIRTVYWIVK